MKIFILEDNPGRIAWFKKHFGQTNIETTSRIFKAIEILKAKKFDLILLDRDVGHPRWSGDDLAFAMWQEKIAVDAPIIVHSMNVQQRQIMMTHLAHLHKNTIQISFKELKLLSPEEILDLAGVKHEESDKKENEKQKVPEL